MSNSFLAWWRLNRSASPERVPAADIEAAIKKLDDDRARGVARRYTRGDVSIQTNDFVTAAEIDSVLGRAPWRS